METPPNSSFPKYTSGSFWGGTVLPFWVLMVFTAFPLTGLLGIDHLLFRSPTTAFAKLLTNVFTLGLWYFYDIIQVFTDKNFVKQYGLSKPMVGPAGLAVDYFSGITGSDTLAPSKSGFLSIVLFLLYLFTVLSPFGLSNFIAGDTEGGIAKFLLSFGPWGLFWIPFLFFAGIFEVYRNITDTEKIFTEGALRPTPLTFLLDPTSYSPNIMNPESIEKTKKETNLYTTFIKPILSMFGITDPMEVIDTTKCQVVPPIEKTVSAAQTAAGGVMALAGTVPAIATKASEKLSAFTDPEKLKEAAQAAAAQKIQMGGGRGVSTVLDSLFVFGLGFLVVGGLFASYLRKSSKQEQDDRPSKPHLL
jgi:hypothetical protein